MRGVSSKRLRPQLWKAYRTCDARCDSFCTKLVQRTRTWQDGVIRSQSISLIRVCAVIPKAAISVQMCSADAQELSRCLENQTEQNKLFLGAKVVVEGSAVAQLRRMNFCYSERTRCCERKLDTQRITTSNNLEASESIHNLAGKEGSLVTRPDIISR